ncbi:heterogeneous nuclear ribonucleoprotein A1 [Senna tora]|uniref:Heterogeneous nuclear ribonucleoprotein A1 n=1 Tax=Senna tora TaxID=362788 RepID=A0A834X3C4_9FABA|nr:heterogeneous nuclear ribonucleoprotein A1 [Senna tora]
MIMDILVADTVTLGVANLLLLRSCYSSTPFSRLLQISAVILPVDALAPPPVRSNTYRMPRRSLLRRKRRAKRRVSGDDSGDTGDEGFFFGDGGDRPFGGGRFGGGGGGGGWNFNGFGEGDNYWDDSSSSYSDPAFDFVYQVLSWIVLSNCLHFAFKRIVRVVTDGIVDADREKVPRRLAPIC